MDDLTQEIIDSALVVWDYQIIALGQHPLTVGNLCTGSVAVFLAFWLSRKLRLFIGHKLLKRFNLTKQESNTFETLIYYACLIFFILLALQLADIPLTTFTIIGGAIALGIGFGSQSVINNFMSGLIILAEKPIKIGDVINLNNIRGVVEHIGTRSTRLRSMYQTHIIIPNSTILSEVVTNWTLASEIVFIDVAVGVAYGSPTDVVKDLLIKAVHKTPDTLNYPEPVVFFEKFGESSLDFTVLFGLKIKNHLERKTVESNVRFTIDDLFRENNIVIAFPQRDVHIRDS